MNEGHKQIEDIVDARRRTGQYDGLCNSIKYHNQGINPRYVYSTYTTNHVDDISKDDNVSVCNHNMEGDNNEFRFLDNSNTVTSTDSEITLIRVKREHTKKNHSNSKSPNANDQEVVLGDGMHLGESPSLVNLVTLVVPNSLQHDEAGSANADDEYLVPLSSWEPEPTEMSTIDLNEACPAPALCDLNLPENQKDSEGSSSNASFLSRYSMEKRKSNVSVKDIFRCMAFWRKEKDKVDAHSDDEGEV